MGNKMTNFIQIQTMVPKKSDAKKIADVLVRKKLSACTQVVGPIESVYNWKGRLEKSKEWLVLIKTKKSLYKKAEREIKKAHPYDVPEIIATPIVAGSRAYLNWVEKEL
jgi:periplasmic divalent cation tolerance protein